MPDLPSDGTDLRAILESVEDRMIAEALERTGGNKNRAAELLGLNRTTLVEKLRRKRSAMSADAVGDKLLQLAVSACHPGQALLDVGLGRRVGKAHVPGREKRRAGHHAILASSIKYWHMARSSSMSRPGGERLPRKADRSGKA
jgi:hypothetical protein